MPLVSHAVWLWNFMGQSQQQKKGCSFCTAFFVLGQSCHYLSVTIKRHFRGCLRTGRVHFCSQSGPVNGITVERIGVLFLALASSQRMTLAKSFNLFEPQFSHL